MEQVSKLTYSPLRSALWLPAGAVLLFLSAVLTVFTPWYISTVVFVCTLLSLIILFKPSWGLYLLVLLVPATPFSIGFIIVAPWNYEIATRYADIIPFFTPLVPLTVAGLLFIKFSRLEQVSFRDPLLLISLLLLGYAGISLNWSANPEHSVFEFFHFLINVLLYLSIVALIDDKKKYRILMWTWIISITVQGIIAMALFAYESVIVSHHLLPTFLFHFRMYGDMLLPNGAPNPAAGLQDFHETSLLTNMAAALCFGMLFTVPKRSKKFALLALLFLFLLFISMRTESRAGIGAMLVMLMALALLIPPLKYRQVRTSVLFIVCAGSLYAATHLYLYTMTEVDQKPRMVFIIEEILGGGKLIDTGHKKKESGRMYMYKRAFRTFFSNQPQRGLGIGNLKYLVLLPHAHSLYFSLILDFGLAGLLFLAALVYILLQRLYLIIKLPDSPNRTMALAATSGLIGAATHCLVDFEYLYTSLWLFLGLVMTSYNMALSVDVDKQTTDRNLLPS
ncbi:MAG: O-antigen ligase family protein [Candidatus Electrothrix sp. GW3-4]|uniref:O-antigen ligase family protein n=1 Tax=Candidatus Electrothrix sp. GW3-4 TaxID=3126740 RepID=UPI0030CC2A31